MGCTGGILLNRNNRWVKLADALPWDELSEIYMESLCADNGRPTIDVRLAIGALIIKHKLKLSDREVVDTIRENVYIQYFVGYTRLIPMFPLIPAYLWRCASAWEPRALIR